MIFEMVRVGCLHDARASQYFFRFAMVYQLECGVDGDLLSYDHSVGVLYEPICPFGWECNAMTKQRKRIFIVLTFIGALLIIWLRFDLLSPRKSDLRKFDPVAV